LSPSPTRVRGFKEILEGKHDDLPEQAFYMVGGSRGRGKGEEARRNSRRIVMAGELTLEIVTPERVTFGGP